MIHNPGEQPAVAAPHFNFMSEHNTIVAKDEQGNPLFFTCPSCGSHHLGAVIYATYKDVSEDKLELVKETEEHIMQCVGCLNEYDREEIQATATPEDKL